MNNLRHKDIKIITRRIDYLENKVRYHSSDAPGIAYDRAEIDALRRLMEIAAHAKED